MAGNPMWHIAKNFALLLLSIAFFQIDTLIITTAYLWHRLVRRRSNRCDGASTPPHGRADRVTILVTGVSMNKGLSLARLFHRRGHRVIGADWKWFCPGRVSSAIDVYCQLPPPSSDPLKPGADDRYLGRILDIVREHDVHLWVSVSDLSAAVQDAVVRDALEDRTAVKTIQFGVSEVKVLHEKDAFMERSRSLSLPIPETGVVRSKQDVVNFLCEHGGLESKPGATKYLIKAVDIDDPNRINLPILPLSSASETLSRLDSIPFANYELPYIIQEFIHGSEFCSHALVVRGRVRAFVACPSSDVLLHYTALPAGSPLSKAMLDFTMKQASVGGEDFTGHLSFDFLVRHEDEARSKGGEEVTVYPLECNPRVHTATVLFDNTPELVDEYLSVLSMPFISEDPEAPPLYPKDARRVYWISQDLVDMVLYPLFLTLFRGTMNPSELWASVKAFSHHVLYWEDGWFDVWDPWPWWWVHHVFWPVRFVSHLFHGAWSQLNVSTGRIYVA